MSFLVGLTTKLLVDFGNILMIAQIVTVVNTQTFQLSHPRNRGCWSGYLEPTDLLIGKPKKNTAISQREWKNKLIVQRRASHARPIGAQSDTERVGLNLQFPAGVIWRPKNLDLPTNQLPRQMRHAQRGRKRNPHVVYQNRVVTSVCVRADKGQGVNAGCRGCEGSSVV